MQSFSKTSQFSFDSETGRNLAIHTAMMGSTKSIWPVGTLNVKFTNHECVKNISMPTSKAKNFLNKRTNSFGIKTVVIAKADYAITGIAKPVQKSFSDQLFYDTATLYTKLLKVTVYNNNTDASQGAVPIAVYNCK